MIDKSSIVGLIIVGLIHVGDKITANPTPGAGTVEFDVIPGISVVADGVVDDFDAIVIVAIMGGRIAGSGTGTDVDWRAGITGSQVARISQTGEGGCGYHDDRGTGCQN